MAVDIHFLGGYPLFGLEDRKDRDNHFWLKMVVEHIPLKELDEPNHLWIAHLRSIFFPSSRKNNHLFFPIIPDRS
jgi:hypothetical protein